MSSKWVKTVKGCYLNLDKVILICIQEGRSEGKNVWQLIAVTEMSDDFVLYENSSEQDVYSYFRTFCVKHLMENTS